MTIGSYKRAGEDIQVLTGIAVSASTQQRLVHRQNFEPASVETAVEEISVDSGKVRLRTPLGKACEWRDYKAVNLHEQAISGFFHDNDSLVSWVNRQPLETPLTCLGDGHDGIWNIYAEIGADEQRREILDWYHLVENLGKVGGSGQRLDKIEAPLWQGEVEAAIKQFDDGSMSELNGLLPTSISIERELSITTTISPKASRLAPVLSNRRSSKSGDG